MDFYEQIDDDFDFSHLMPNYQLKLALQESCTEASRQGVLDSEAFGVVSNEEEAISPSSKAPEAIGPSVIVVEGDLVDPEEVVPSSEQRSENLDVPEGFSLSVILGEADPSSEQPSENPDAPETFCPSLILGEADPSSQQHSENPDAPEESLSISAPPLELSNTSASLNPENADVNFDEVFHSEQIGEIFIEVETTECPYSPVEKSPVVSPKAIEENPFKTRFFVTDFTKLQPKKFLSSSTVPDFPNYIKQKIINSVLESKKIKEKSNASLKRKRRSPLTVQKPVENDLTKFDEFSCETDAEITKRAKGQQKKNAGIILGASVMNFMDITFCQGKFDDAGHIVINEIVQETHRANFLIGFLMGLLYDFQVSVYDGICGVSFLDILNPKWKNSETRISIQISTINNAQLLKLYGPELTIERIFKRDHISGSKFYIHPCIGERIPVNYFRIFQLLQTLQIDPFGDLCVLDQTNLDKIVKSNGLGYQYFQDILDERKEEFFVNYMKERGVHIPEWMPEPYHLWVQDEQEAQKSELQISYQNIENNMIKELSLAYELFLEMHGRNGKLIVNTESKEISLSILLEDSNFLTNYEIKKNGAQIVWNTMNDELKLLAAIGLQLSLWSMVKTNLLFAHDATIEFPMKINVSDFVNHALASNKAKDPGNQQQLIFTKEPVYSYSASKGII